MISQHQLRRQAEGPSNGTCPRLDLRLVPRLCLGTNCFRGSASLADAQMCNDTLLEQNGGGASSASGDSLAHEISPWRRETALATTLRFPRRTISGQIPACHQSPSFDLVDDNLRIP